MGRHIPTVDDEERERELQVIATKGGTYLSILMEYSRAIIQYGQRVLSSISKGSIINRERK